MPRTIPPMPGDTIDERYRREEVAFYFSSQPRLLNGSLGCCPGACTCGGGTVHCTRHSNGRCGWFYARGSWCEHCAYEARMGVPPSKPGRIRKKRQNRRSIERVRRQSIICKELAGNA